MEVTRNGPVLVLRGGDLRVHVRPGRGGRIDRLFHGPSGGFQPVFVSGTACRTPRPGDAFEEHDTYSSAQFADHLEKTFPCKIEYI